MKGHNLLIVLKRKVLRRELNGIGGPVGIHIDLQALCLVVVGGLYLNRNQLPVTLNDEIYFGPAFGLPITGVISADGKLHIDIIFCHTALEVVQLLDHVENIVGGQVFLGTEQPQVGHIDFQRVNIAIVFQGLFDLLHPVDPKGDAGQAEPFDGIF